jgi:hypothetical protein
MPTRAASPAWQNSERDFGGLRFIDVMADRDRFGKGIFKGLCRFLT